MKFLYNKLGVVAVVAVLALVVGLVLVFFPRSDKQTLVADYPRTVSLYEGSDVRILGVKVGTVDKVDPDGTKVHVTMSWDAKYPVPADAKAVLIAPAIVGDRYIQLTPGYSGGAKLPDNAHFGTDRTATPVELDTIYANLTQISTALGPDGANKPDASGKGALTRLLESTAANFGGQGEQFNKTIGDIATLSQTLDNNKEDLFGSVREIEGFVNTLARNDTTVRRFNDALSQASDLLAGERDDLASALRNLGTALVAVRGFVRDNRAILTRDVTGLRRVTDTLVKRRDQLDDILRIAPGALNNLGLAYNPKTGTLDQRTNVGQSLSSLNLGGLSGIVCGLAAQQKKSCESLFGTLGVGAANTADTSQGATGTGEQGSAASPLDGLADGLGRAAALQRSTSPTSSRDAYVDRSLGGLVGGRR